MYSSCGADVFEVDIGSGDFLLEQTAPGASGYNCHYSTFQQQPYACDTYVPDTWITYYYKVSIGTWSQPNSTIQAWTSVNGEPYTQWIYLPNHTLTQNNLNDGSG